jgi:bacterial/archaeal transporter family protein
MNWLISAFFSALAAALVAIFGKMGLKNIDSTLATTIRAVIMAVFLVLVCLSMGKFRGFSVKSLGSTDWGLIAAAGIAGALSWLFYFFALKSGNATQVAAIDRLSLVFVAVLAAVFLGEHFGVKTAAGAALMVIGAVIINLK